eukprot:TRINITY_DN17215_c0_g1_i1.p1 TRINITY_DN17215_c0_g1~~TRINITY_DN17215_c0_g1_i1.p1  ORF type:complete len:605 (+),score=77.79 TRINITY_DN17215_c0_g1_i1:159-1973(+)
MLSALVGMDFSITWELLEGSNTCFSLQDTRRFLRTLGLLLYGNGQHSVADDPSLIPQAEWTAAQALFQRDFPVWVARAPGRLDVMGGIADYSGSLVLQMPIREACHVAVQCPPAHSPESSRSDTSGAAVPNSLPTSATEALPSSVSPDKSKSRYPGILRIVSFGATESHRSASFSIPLSTFYSTSDPSTPISYEEARELFAKVGGPTATWAAYVAGTLLVLMQERGVRFGESDVCMLVSSEVPEGKGVSSSAAVEVAAMSAVAAAMGEKVKGRDMAVMCQMVENRVVGAPCGIMDQMASACGQQDRLLALLCQPATIVGHVPIPPHLRFWGLDSGIRHSVGGADYGTVRTGAFMGRRIIQSLAEQARAQRAPEVSSALKKTSPAASASASTLTHQSSDDSLLEHLCRLPPHRFETCYAESLPKEMSGADFSAAYGSHGDAATKVEANRIYAVSAPAAHPVYENFRVQTFAQLLEARESETQMALLGELMFQSHASYSRCGLGSEGTDHLAALTRLLMAEEARGEEGGANEGSDCAPSLFGVKITGGGSGGTVCILGRTNESGQKSVLKLQQQYEAASGLKSYLFQGSSPGAAQFGFLKLRYRQE